MLLTVFLYNTKHINRDILIVKAVMEIASNNCYNNSIMPGNNNNNNNNNSNNNTVVYVCVCV